jgi:hypothetical protein
MPEKVNPASGQPVVKRVSPVPQARISPALPSYALHQGSVCFFCFSGQIFKFTFLLATVATPLLGPYTERT